MEIRRFSSWPRFRFSGQSRYSITRWAVIVGLSSLSSSLPPPRLWPKIGEAYQDQQTCRSLIKVRCGLVMTCEIWPIFEGAEQTEYQRHICRCRQIWADLLADLLVTLLCLVVCFSARGRTFVGSHHAFFSRRLCWCAPAQQSSGSFIIIASIRRRRVARFMSIVGTDRDQQPAYLSPSNSTARRCFEK